MSTASEAVPADAEITTAVAASSALAPAPAADFVVDEVGHQTL